MHGSRLGLLILGILLLATWPALAQVGKPKPAQTKEGQRVKVIHAMEFNLLQEAGQSTQKLRGKVELRQDSIFMDCDSAIIINETLVFAYGNVIIQQGDSLQVFADSLEYDGASKLAALEGNVILVNGPQQLFTDRLDYDLNTRVARYSTGATLTSDSLQLSSRRGYYYVKEQEAYFRDSVVVVDPRFSLRADTMKFKVDTKTVVFLGPTLINSDSSKIYCEDGFYDTQKKLAEFSRNAQYLKGDQTAVADTILYDDKRRTYTLQGKARVEDSLRLAEAELIRYDELRDQIYLRGSAHYREGEQDIRSEEINYDRKNKTYTTKGRSYISDPPQILQADSVQFADQTGLGIAMGNVTWQDTVSNYSIACAQAEYDKSSDYLKASGGLKGRPEMISLLDADSLFMSSDTLVSLRADTIPKEDPPRKLLAYGKVRIFKSDLQAICDSLAYSEVDSAFVLFGNPYIWSDTSQFSADTIYLYMRGGKIDRIDLRTNAFITILSDRTFFNQVRGRNVLAYFQDNDIRRMDASGNAEVIYYAKDDKGAYIGVNQIACSDMILRFGQNQIERITFLTEPNSKLLPMGQVKHNELRLKGFRWEEEGRPLSREDIFVSTVREAGGPGEN